MLPGILGPGHGAMNDVEVAYRILPTVSAASPLTDSVAAELLPGSAHAQRLAAQESHARETTEGESVLGRRSARRSERQGISCFDDRMKDFGDKSALLVQCQPTPRPPRALAKQHLRVHLSERRARWCRIGP